MTPLYDWRCPDCKQEVEAPLPPICRRCLTPMKKVYRPPTVVWPKDKRGH